MTKNQIDYWNMKETGRHNLATEAETNRHNVVSEGIDLGRLNESIRHNQETEAQGRTNLSINQFNALENQRHNMATESESNRHNTSVENETARSNKANERLHGVDLNIKAGQLAVSEAAQRESARHNLAAEAIDWERVDSTRNLQEAQAKVAKAEAALKTTQNTWESIKSNQQVNLTTAQVAKIDREMDKLFQDAEKARREGNMVYADRVIDSVNTLANLVRAFKD